MNSTEQIISDISSNLFLLINQIELNSAANTWPRILGLLTEFSRSKLSNIEMANKWSELLNSVVGREFRRSTISTAVESILRNDLNSSPETSWDIMFIINQLRDVIKAERLFVHGLLSEIVFYESNNRLTEIYTMVQQFKSYLNQYRDIVIPSQLNYIKRLRLEVVDKRQLSDSNLAIDDDNNEDVDENIYEKTSSLVLMYLKQHEIYQHNVSEEVIEDLIKTSVL